MPTEERREADTAREARVRVMGRVVQEPPETGLRSRGRVVVEPLDEPRRAAGGTRRRASARRR